jgi:gentisate 1,2-dioxygenase
MVAFFDAGFAERYPDEVQPVTKQEGDALARYGATLLPVDYEAQSLTTPVFAYPYARSRAALEVLRRSGPLHACHGLKLQYANPASGGYPMPTIAAFLQLLPAGFNGDPYRSTDGTVYCVVEGQGRSNIGEASFAWGPRDVFVVPSWCTVSHHAQSDAVLFSFSDRPVQKAMGVWREQAPARST